MFLHDLNWEIQIKTIILPYFFSSFFEIFWVLLNIFLGSNEDEYTWLFDYFLIKVSSKHVNKESQFYPYIDNYTEIDLDDQFKLGINAVGYLSYAFLLQKNGYNECSLTIDSQFSQRLIYWSKIWFLSEMES